VRQISIRSMSGCNTKMLNSVAFISFVKKSVSLWNYLQWPFRPASNLMNSGCLVSTVLGVCDATLFHEQAEMFWWQQKMRCC